jgi:uncharacterized protein
VNIRLRLLSENYAVCRLGPHEEVPSWARGDVVSTTRTSNELSIVCREQDVPQSVRSEREWRCLMVEGPIPFETTGIAAAIASPLAAAGISLFLVSTFDTDYVFVKAAVLRQTIEVLRAAGCVVLTDS